MNKLTELKTRADFGKLIKAKGFKVGAEIGVAYGENAEKMLEQSDCFLHLVDPWEEQPQAIWPQNNIIGNFQECFVYCHGKLARFKGRTEFHRMYSDDAANKFHPYELDFVYLDGNHKSPQVDRDLENWYPKVKPGGIIGGHDYFNNEWSDVETAVNKFVEKYKLKLHLSDIDSTTEPLSWWIQK